MKYVLGLIGFIILAVIAFVLLSATTASRRDDILEGEKVVQLTDYIDTGTVTFTQQGRVIADEEYREIRIAVNPTGRRVQVIQGYNGAVLKERSFPNNSASFDAFMRSLAKAGYTLERKTNNEDMRGVCPNGRRLMYDVQDSSSQVSSLWSTTCSNKEGTFGGNDSLVEDLFQNQIPAYDDFVTEVDL